MADNNQLVHEVLASSSKEPLVAKVFPPFDFSFAPSNIWWLVVSFGFFYLFIARTIVPRIGNIIETRKSRIASDFDQALRLQQEAEELSAKYQNHLKNARLQAQNVAQDSIKKSKDKFAKEVAEHERDISNMLIKAEADLAHRSIELRSNINDIAVDLSEVIIKKMFPKNVPEDVTRINVKTIRESGE